MALTSTDPAVLLSRLGTALDRFDDPRVRALCAELIGLLGRDLPPLTAGQGAEVLRMLRRKRRFDLMCRVAEALIHSGLDQPGIRRGYAQALLDQGEILPALSILETVAGNEDPAEAAEARGLVGRAYKQLFLRDDPQAAPQRRGADLARAVVAYHDVYAADPTMRWHGVNAASLLCLAAAERREVPGFPDPAGHAAEIARNVLAAVTADPRPSAWDQATAVEACLVLGRSEDAPRWLDGYLGAPDTDAFEVASTLRQLVELWGLDAGRPPGDLLLPALRAGLLEREGGAVALPVAEVGLRLPAARLEKVFGAERFQSVRWFEDALARCRAVGRIEDEYEDGVGTGFLVDGKALADWLPATVFLTNAHVIPYGVDLDDAYVTFRGIDRGSGAAERYRFASQVWTSSPDDLDVTVLTLASLPDGVAPCPVASKLPALDASPPPRAFIVGHPLGRPDPVFSIQDNLLLDYDETRVHYRAPTEPGSSGSPVLDSRWRLIAVHHAGHEHMRRLHGDGTYQANEGIAVSRLRRALRETSTR